jgi:hypothetical protein
VSDDFKQASHRQLPAEQDDHSSPCLAPAELEALGFRKRPLLQVIRAKCIDCCAGQKTEVRRCGMRDCPSWPYRMGTNPWHHRRLTEGQRTQQAQRLRANVPRMRKD